MESNSNLKSQFAVLFVDDEEKLRKYFAMSVKKDFEVLCASNVEEAQGILDEHHERIGVVLTDQRMPGGNGVVLLKFLKEKYPKIVRLLTTAYSDLSDAIDAINKGEIIRYIQKPWDFNLLSNELSSAMELFELRLQCDNLMNEKLSIKKKSEKVNKVKLLMSLAAAFGDLKDSKRSVANYVKNFVVNESNLEEVDSNFLRLSDMGGKDVEEVKTLSNMVGDVVSKIREADNLNEFTNVDFKNVILESKNNADVEVEGSLNDSLKANSKSLKIAFEALFSLFDSGSKIKISLQDKVIKGEFVGFEFAASSVSNVLIFCLFLGHNGFEIENFGASGFSLKFVLDKEFDDENLDDLILSVML